MVRPLKVALELQVIGRIGKDEIDAGRGKLLQFGDAIANEDARGRTGLKARGLKTDAGRPDGRPATRHNHDSEL
jgi:hypothetical protein